MEKGAEGFEEIEEEERYNKERKQWWEQKNQFERVKVIWESYSGSGWKEEVRWLL